MKCQVLALLVAVSLALAQYNAPYSEDQLRDVNNRYGSNSFEAINPTGTNVLLQNQVLSPGFDNDQQSQWLSVYETQASSIAPQSCGNGILEGYELCEYLAPWTNNPTCIQMGYSPLPGPAASTQIGCNQQCSWDRQGITNFQCSGSSSSVNPNNCGNGVVDAFEQCDGSNLGGATCETVGLGFNGGTLGCRTYEANPSIQTCQFDFSGCTRSTPGCGDGVIEGVEQCDPPGSTANCNVVGLTDYFTSPPASGAAIPGLVCSPTCDWDLGYCRPYALQSTMLYEAGTPFSGEPPLCGNNIVDAGEQCDGTILNGATCLSLGYQTGTVACSGCRYDIRGCGTQGGLVTVAAVGPDVTDVEVGDVVAIAANATCAPFALNNFNTDRNQYCIVDESAIAVTLLEGNLFFDKTDVINQAGFSSAVPISGDSVDNF